MTAIVEPRVELIEHRNQGEETEEEVWKPIAGYEGLYEVSNQGRVRSLDRVVTSSSGQVYARKGRTLKVSPGNVGYPVVGLSRAGVVKNRLVHRLVLETFVGPPEEGLEACHNNGVKTDNRLSNLRWGTSAENTEDIRRHGRMYQLKITHCPSGHEYTRENVYLYQNRRYCRACRSGKRKKND